MDDKIKEILAHPNVIGSVISAHIKAFCGFSKLAIQGCFLLNGTVGIAAFATKGFAPLWCCSVGAICAIAGAFFAYQCQLYYMNCDMLLIQECVDKNHQDAIFQKRYYQSRQAEAYAKRAKRYCIASVLCFCISLAYMAASL